MAKVTDFKIERRPSVSHSYVATFGRASVSIVCPFCGQTVVAYLWSLAGCGKKCPCGAKHVSGNMTIKKVEVTETQNT